MFNLIRNYEDNDKSLYRSYDSIFSQWISFDEFIENNLLFLGDPKAVDINNGGGSGNFNSLKRDREEDEIYNLNVCNYVISFREMF